MLKKNKVIFWGGTGQALVNRSILDLLGYDLVAIFDDTPELVSPFEDVELFLGWNGFEKWKYNKLMYEYSFCISIGNPHGNIRLKIANLLKKEGLHPLNLIHPSAIIDQTAVIGEGVQVMAGAIIQAKAVIGKQCIINTKASIDHEVELGDGCEVGPGATLCGNISLKENVWICAGATVLPRLTIGENSIVGASSLLTKNIRNNQLFFGVPARYIREI